MEENAWNSTVDDEHMSVYDQEVARSATMERCRERTNNQIAFFQYFDELVSTLLLFLSLYFLSTIAP